MLNWSSNNNPAFNSAKTKTMLFTTNKMEKLHLFEQNVVELKCKDKSLENVNKIKFLGITIDKILNWKKHINCYITLSILLKVQRYTSVLVWKQLTESFVLLKPDYCNELLFDIPKYIKELIQKVQNAAAVFF